MKVGILTRNTYRNNGLDTFEQNICPWLLSSFTETQKITAKDNVRNWYPFSNTIEKIKQGRRLTQKTQGKDFDKIFVPNQELMTPNPNKTKTEIIPYIHDIFTGTTYYPNQTNLLEEQLRHLTGTKYLQNIHKCNTVITASKTTAKTLKRRTGYQGNTKTIYQGIDDKHRLTSHNKKRNIDLLYIGNATHGRKNPELVKHSIEKATEKGLSTAYINHTELDLEVEQEYVNVSNLKLARICGDSRFLLHASHLEGFGRCPVEAQRYGCIPIAQDTPINHEILGPENQSWLKAETSKDILRLANSGYRKQMRKSARENSQRFRWSQTRRQIAETLDLK